MKKKCIKNVCRDPPMYSKEIMKRWRNPKHEGVVKNGIKAHVGNGLCKDFIDISMSLKDNKIKEIKYITYGCQTAVSSIEYVCELATGKTLKEANKISVSQISKFLKPPKWKIHCFEMAVNALKTIIKEAKK